MAVVAASEAAVAVRLGLARERQREIGLKGAHSSSATSGRSAPRSKRCDLGAGAMSSPGKHALHPTGRARTVRGWKPRFPAPWPVEDRRGGLARGRVYFTRRITDPIASAAGS